MPVWLWFKGLSIGAKLGVAVGAIVALVLAFTLLVHTVSVRDERLKQAGRDEVTAAWNAEKAGRQEAKAEFQTSLSATLRPMFDGLSATVGNIDRKAAEINVKLPQAIAASPRYADPNCALTPDVLSQVNAARALSADEVKP
jgi:gas vesicle protein